jgi:hypothetical protein
MVMVRIMRGTCAGEVGPPATIPRVLTAAVLALALLPLVVDLPGPATNQPNASVNHAAKCLICHWHGRSGREAPVWAVGRRVRPYKGATRTRLAAEIAEGT